MSGLEPGQARITHPDPGVEDAVVPASAVPHHERAGWTFVEGDRETWPAEAQQFSGQAAVRISNPTLPGQVVTVAESAVPHWQSVGWQVIDEQAEAQADLEGRTVAELRELAKARGVSPLPTAKAGLLAALQPEQAQEEQAGEEPAPPQEQEA